MLRWIVYSLDCGYESFLGYVNAASRELAFDCAYKRYPDASITVRPVH